MGHLGVRCWHDEGIDQGPSQGPGGHSSHNKVKAAEPQGSSVPRPLKASQALPRSQVGPESQVGFRERCEEKEQASGHTGCGPRNIPLEALRVPGQGSPGPLGPVHHTGQSGVSQTFPVGLCSQTRSLSVCPGTVDLNSP